MLGRSELHEGAKQVRAALAKARLRAIESGAPQRFRYRPGTGRFEVAALPISPDESEAPSASARTRQRRDDAPAAETIPSGVWFVEPGSARNGPDTENPRPTADNTGWSGPIVFFPNGRSSDARIRLAGSGGFYVEISLRGLTGSTRIGLLERPEERP